MKKTFIGYKPKESVSLNDDVTIELKDGRVFTGVCSKVPTAWSTFLGVYTSSHKEFLFCTQKFSEIKSIIYTKNKKIGGKI